MARGIDYSKVFISFLTKEYMTKANGSGQRGVRDNCHLEFKYAVMKKTPDYMVVVVLEEVGNSFDEFFRSRNLDKLFLSEP